VRMRVWAIAIAIAMCSMTSVAGAQTSGDMPETRDMGGLEGVQGMLPNTQAREDASTRIQSPPPPISGPIDPNQYRVGPGDILQLQLWGRVTRTWTLTVGPEGYVMIPGLGSSMVTGQTLTSARAEILRKVEDRFHGVGMDLRLSRPRTFNIYLTGQVKAPGQVQALASYRVADVLPEVGLLDNGSRRRIEVMHKDGTRDYADLVVFTRNGVQTANPMLRDGDVINVPVAMEWVYAQGALGRAGQIELGVNDSLLTLFQLAGDPQPAAVVDKALLVRWTDPFRPESLWVRLDDVYARRTNPQLRDGDRLYVYYIPQYHVQHEVWVFGEVARPGGYPISEGRHHLSDLIRAAGGFLPTADLTAIRVHRRNPGAGEKDPELDRLLRLSREQLTASEYDKLTTKLAALREDYRIDWTRLNNSPNELDLLLRDGDIVRVERLVSSIRIDGEVRRPGILSFRPGLQISDYVKQAGGFTTRAWNSRIRVTRAVTGQTLPAKNVRSLDPGDFVWVPERPDKSPLDYMRETLTAVAQIATVVIAIRSIR
jgi:polysaccharide biosynthesis/export protein